LNYGAQGLRAGWCFDSPRRVAAVLCVLVAAVVVFILAWKLAGGGGSTGDVLGAGEHRGSLNSAALPVAPGSVGDFSALVDDSSRSPVSLVSAKLIPMSGRGLPQLVGVAIATTSSYEEPGRGWPKLDVPTRSFPGRVEPGRTWLIWGATGNQIGKDYSALGLQVIYRLGDHDHSVSVWGPGTVCVRPSSQHHSDHQCSQDSELALKAAESKSG
jgi:hypothetical protein